MFQKFQKIIVIIKNPLEQSFDPFCLVGKSKRQKVVLNILLSFSVAAFLAINGIKTINQLLYGGSANFPPWPAFLILLYLFCLIGLSWYGKTRLVSILLISLYFILLISCLILRGADWPSGLLLSALVITMAAALLGTQPALEITIIISGLLIFLTGLQNQKILNLNNYWRQETNQIEDALIYSVLLLIIAGITCIFSRGIKQSLARARHSEKALRTERDTLEIKVREKTQELRQIEQQKINQLYRLAEFGQLSSGIFHDLINPLTAVSLNLEQINGEVETISPGDDKIYRAKSHLQQALLAARKMECLIAGVKKQIQAESELTTFTPDKEIIEIIQILAYKARRADVQINFTGAEDIIITGDAIKFGQIIINLLANAIDASEDLAEAQYISIKLESQSDKIIITIRDQGVGILPENINRIFDPFFSTKQKFGQGMGIGLALTKNIIEKNFSGTISVSSQFGQGAIFTVELPMSVTVNKKNAIITTI